MGQTVFFSNDGEMDILGATIMGVHVKEGSNPIGHFGTGLKFAIATLLRTGHAVKIYVGEKLYNFDVEKVNIRGKDFDVVCMNGDRLGFTTDTGKNWEVWMAYRELRCNAMDEPNWFVTDNEDEAIVHGPDFIGRTNIIVTGEGISQAHRERNTYFCGERELLFSSPGLGEIYAGESKYVFYRGVAALKMEKPTLYTYNIISEQQLTEDRTLREGWWIPYVLGQIMSKCEVKEVIDRVLPATNDYAEARFDYSNGSPSEEFMETAMNHRNNFHANQSAMSLWHKKADIKNKIDLVKPTEEEITELALAMSFCRIADPSFNLTLEEINIAVTLGEGVMGLYADNEVYIARNVIQSMGTIAVAGTLLEEWVHRTYKFKDESRSMQNYLLDRLLKICMRG